MPWGNIVEHGRYALEFAGEKRILYFASSEAQLRTTLERQLGRGLRTWAAIFKEKGYIPTGLGAGGMGGGYSWEDMSDSGGYAHLISACAQWLLYLDGQRDWEVHRLPAPKP